MTTFVFANNIDTTLASSISSSATTITLSSGTNLPVLAAGQTFVVTLNDAATQQVFEVMYATAISGTMLTVSRAQEGTTPQAWAAGDYVFSGPTAGQMRSFYQGQSVGQGTVTSVGMSMPSGFSVSGSPVTVAGTLGVTFASQNAGLFLATPVTGGAAGAATWRSMAAADVNGALGYTAANAATVVTSVNGFDPTSGNVDVGTVTAVTVANANGVSASVANQGSTPELTISLGAITPESIASGLISVAQPGADGFGIEISGATAAGASVLLTGNGSTTPSKYLRAWNGVFSIINDAGNASVFDVDDAGNVTLHGSIEGANINGVAAIVQPGTSGYGMSISGATLAGAAIKLVGNGSTTPSKMIAAQSGVLNFMNDAASQAIFQMQDNGNATCAGALTCTTMNASSSDRRLKRDIKPFEPRPIHRAVPFVSYTLKENGWHGLGSVAQRMQKVAPEHVGEFDWYGKKRLSLDYSRAAYEEAMWAGLALDKALDRIKVLEKRLAALERRV